MSKLNDVKHAFDCVQSVGRVMRIDRKGHVFPEGGHFQGVQRFPGTPDRVIVTSSSDSKAYMVTCRLEPTAGKDGRVETVSVLNGSPLDHAGGFQAEEEYFAVGVEDFDGRDRSEVQLWHLTHGGAAHRLKTIARSGPKEVSTAGAVGVLVRDRGALLAVGTWDCKTIDFYSSPWNPFTDSSAAFSLWRTWRKSDAIKDGWIDGNFGNYQSINLLEQTNDGDRVFLIAFNRSDGKDWMDLFSVDLRPQSSTNRMLHKLAKKHMTCKEEAEFGAGAGVSVVSPHRFEVYAVKGTSGHYATGTTITLNRFLAD